MELLDNPMRRYAWGSRTAIAEATGPAGAIAAPATLNSLSAEALGLGDSGRCAWRQPLRENRLAVPGPSGTCYVGQPPPGVQPD